jgi:predicted RNase H-like HicB family nuclease
MDGIKYGNAAVIGSFTIHPNREPSQLRVLFPKICLKGHKNEHLKTSGPEEMRCNLEKPKYLVIIEKEKGTYGAYVPDLPGCVAVAKNKPRVSKLITEAIDLHLEDMRSRGLRIPRPRTQFELIAVG